MPKSIGAYSGSMGKISGSKTAIQSFQMPSLRHYVPWNRFQGQANYFAAEAAHLLTPILLNQIVGNTVAENAKVHRLVLARYNTGMGFRTYPCVWRGRFYRPAGGAA